MKIDTNAFLESLPIMGVGLLGIFIVTIVIIIGIYILRALTKDTGDNASKDGDSDSLNESTPDASGVQGKKESAMDLMNEREKKDFFEEVDNNYISQDL